MPSRVVTEPELAQDRVDVAGPACSSAPDIHALNALALRALKLLFQEKRKLFSRRLTVTEKGIYQEEASHRRTIIALLGLLRAAKTGMVLPFDISSICDTVFSDTNWVKSIADLGLLTWLTAECFPGRLGALFYEFDFGKALDTYSDGWLANTVSLSWFLTGIAHARLECIGGVPDLTDIAVDTFHLLQNNQAESGIFGHVKTSRFPSIAYWSRFGTFADQVFAIRALSSFARAFQIEEPLASALACANSVRALQGKQGQWWYLYEKRDCRVLNHYPVMSLHQNGSAPMALFALEEATGQHFQEAAYRGLSWVAGANELGNDLRDSDQGLIWDSIAPRNRLSNFWEAVINYTKGVPHASTRSLRIQYEARPDHFGWLLYSFARFGLQNEEADVPLAGYKGALANARQPREVGRPLGSDNPGYLKR
jgi:hypothetical protein